MEAKALFYSIQYINLHIQDEIIFKDMAARFGYTEYYLTRKFKKETGMTLKEYIREQNSLELNSCLKIRCYLHTKSQKCSISPRRVISRKNSKRNMG